VNPKPFVVFALSLILLGATGCLQHLTPDSTATSVRSTFISLPPTLTLLSQIPTATPTPQPTP